MRSNTSKGVAMASTGVRAPLALVLAALAAAVSSGASEQFTADTRALTVAPHRLAGTRECGEAARYVEERLRGMGLDAVLVQEFPTAQTAVRRCELVLTGPSGGNPRTLPLMPVRSDGIIPPVTPPEGIAGPIMRAGAGKPEDFGASPEGRIVVLDYNCGHGWLRAFSRGARAVVFTASDRPQAWQALHVDANANLPRFYYQGDPEDLADGFVATIRSEVVWEPATGRNVVGFLRGTDPVFHLERGELIVLAAHLDTFGEVPRLSPGARGAANCAGLLGIAERFAQERPRRHTLFAFFDGQARGHAGSAAFYRVLEDNESEPVHIKKRLEYLKNENAFLEELRGILGSATPWRVDSPVRRRFLTRLKDKAAEHVGELNAAQFALRKERRELAADSPAYKDLQARIEGVQSEKDSWNQLRRILLKVDQEQQAESLPDHVAGKLAVAMREVGRDVDIRAAELEREGRALKTDQDLAELVGASWIGLHVSLVFGDTSPGWGLVVGGDSFLRSWGDDPGLYGRIQGTFLAAYESTEGREEVLGRFVRETVDTSFQLPQVFWAAPYLIHSGEVAGRHGIYNLALTTCQENLSREGTPADTLDALDVENLSAQASEAGVLLRRVADEEGLSLRRAIAVDKRYAFPEFRDDNQVHGPVALAKVHGSPSANTPVPGAVVQVNMRWRDKNSGALPYRARKVYAFDDFALCMANQNGSYFVGPVQSWWPPIAGFAVSFDERGMARFATTLDSAARLDNRLEMFECRHGVAVMPPQLDIDVASVLEAESDFPLQSDKSFCETYDGVVYWYCEEKVRGIKLFGKSALVCLSNAAPAGSGSLVEDLRESTGKGLPQTGVWTMPDAVSMSADDMWRLNESRMKLLRSRAVIDKSVQELHGRAEDLRSAAVKAGTLAEADALSASAFMAEAPVYTETRSTLDDLVRAVLVLLALSVPFSFALERLLVGSTNIYRQIMWFCIFFVLTFLTLYFSHPAFAISTAPMIIFLGFAVLVLSMLVIVIIMRKFEVELKVMQGLTATVHTADVSRFNTIMAAMGMGISTMRRRPMRTALTAVTIILLTFTILCFASFGRRTGVIKLFILPPPGYAGVNVHKVDWQELSPDLPEIVRGRWGAAARVCGRYWVSPKDKRTPGKLVSREDGSSHTALKGVLGLEVSEVRQRKDLADLIGQVPDDFEDSVWMTRAVANRLDIKPDDHVLLGGARLRFAGTFDPGRAAAVEDMDGSSVLPVDFNEVKGTQQPAGGAEEAALRGGQEWAILPADSVAVVSAAVARRMGATLRSLTIYATDTRAASDIGEDLARMLPIPVASTRSDGVYRQMLGSAIQAGGVKDLLFPILLGGLVIFGTMLGSVADREREIYSFSALGLAPPHVAGLFLAEAMVYSVIGGLGGYLLAQATMKVLGYLAGFGLATVPEMNHSSTNAIVTLLIVMATVLVSAIYPAIRASRSANPGILRSWRVPAPQGDTFDITFPFTVSEYDITGVVSFLKEHFDNFTDTSLGAFMSKDAAITRGAEHGIGLAARLWLAPFDLGVTQDFEMLSTPSEIKGIDEIRIRIARKSGQPKDWQRLNKVLFDDLRRQFLIWRSLPGETMEIYRDRTLTALAKDA